MLVRLTVTRIIGHSMHLLAMPLCLW